MGKGVAKFAGKSGILPVTRQILKKPLRAPLQPAAGSPQTHGYAEGVQHPKGSHRESPAVEVLDVSKFIAETVQEPKAKVTGTTEAQRHKLIKADLRREFAISSIAKEREQLARNEVYEQEKLTKEQRKQEERLKEAEESQAAKLTVPTVSQFLTGTPFIRQRTEEEKEILDAKRRANRMDIELKAQERKATELLQLYYASESFIINEEQLKTAIDEAFAKENQYAMKLSIGSSLQSKSKARNDTAVGDALFGTIGGKYPGLPVIEEWVSGELDEFKKEISK